MPCLCHTLTAGTHHPVGLKQFHSQHVCFPTAAGSDVKHWMDGWAKQPGFPLITLRIARQDGKAADDDSEDDDDDQAASSSAPLRLTAQQVGVVGILHTFAAYLAGPTAAARRQKYWTRACSSRRHLRPDSSWRAAAPATAAPGGHGGCRWRTSQGAQAATRSAPPAGWCWTPARQVFVCQDTTYTETCSIALKIGVMDHHLHRHAADARCSS